MCKVILKDVLEFLLKFVIMKVTGIQLLTLFENGYDFEGHMFCWNTQKKILVFNAVNIKSADFNERF